jgi:hypothetical protein
MNQSKPLPKHIAQVCRNELTPFINKNNNIFWDDWRGACAICSKVLFDVLKFFNYKPNYISGEYEGCEHFFVLLNNYIIDITATQFDQDPVYITPESNKCYTINYVDKAALSYLKNWDKAEQPATYSRQIKKIKNRIINKINSKEEG